MVDVGAGSIHADVAPVCKRGPQSQRLKLFVKRCPTEKQPQDPHSLEHSQVRRQRRRSTAPWHRRNRRNGTGVIEDSRSTQASARHLSDHSQLAATGPALERDWGSSFSQDIARPVLATPGVVPVTGLAVGFHRRAKVHLAADFACLVHQAACCTLRTAFLRSKRAGLFSKLCRLAKVLYSSGSAGPCRVRTSTAHSPDRRPAHKASTAST